MYIVLQKHTFLAESWFSVSQSPTDGDFQDVASSKSTYVKTLVDVLLAAALSNVFRKYTPRFFIASVFFYHILFQA